MMNNSLEWEQINVQHCPNKDCKGMLLQSKYLHEEKCSNCGKIFLQLCEYQEIKTTERKLEKVTFDED